MPSPPCPPSTHELHHQHLLRPPVHPLLCRTSLRWGCSTFSAEGDVRRTQNDRKGSYSSLSNQNFGSDFSYLSCPGHLPLGPVPKGSDSAASAAPALANTRKRPSSWHLSWHTLGCSNLSESDWDRRASVAPALAKIRLQRPPLSLPRGCGESLYVSKDSDGDVHGLELEAYRAEMQAYRARHNSPRACARPAARL